MFYFLAGLLAVVIVGGDQIAKMMVVEHLTRGTEVKNFIPGLINFVYVQNEGGAWGFLENNTWLLIGLTVVIMLICMTLLIKKGAGDKIFFFGIICVMSGGIGNLIDRIFRKYVVDFIQFAFWTDFPVFNIADMAICIGAGLLILYFLIDFMKDRKAKRLLNNYTPDAVLQTNDAEQGDTESSDN
ncbi:MAG: signal peptidase II [Oscillospiraceae bacterium]|nr:signal peptidase II [Candidatus Equicaccousia limihippi]